MKTQKILVSLVAIFALAILTIASVSASSMNVEVSGFDNPTDLAVFAGQTLPVVVSFVADFDASDVRVKAWISGDKEYTVSTERFDVITGKRYSKFVMVEIPSNIDPSEDLKLEVLVESRNDGTMEESEVELSAQRESYNVEILDAEMNSEVKAGTSLPIDIVLKNRGYNLAEDTFVKVTIPSLGIVQKAYFGDLSSVDEANPDKEDSVAKRIVLNIPSNAATGLYLVELQVYNADSNSVVTKKVSVVSGANGNSLFVTDANSKTFAANDRTVYSLTLVNSGDKIRVYNLVAQTSSSLTVDFDESTVIVPAGTSKTVNFNVVASKEGEYSFAVDVYSDNELTKSNSFLANVDNSAKTGFAGNATLVLTIVLAIIFVVLLVVLIVLLTRKPESKTEEFGESYY